MIAFRLVASWVLAVALVAFFLHVTLHPWPNPVPGYVKFYDAPGENLLFSALSASTGVSLFEPAGRFASGVLELIAGLLILLPASRRVGAGFAALLLGTGVGLHLSPWLSRELPLPEGGTDGGAHFLVYVIFLALSILLLVVHPRERSRH
ncbi:hypothetical protein [Hyphomonas sp.]|jgi:hypothetical protein|uniref:hypothetical protein n=1 Tax=Hyphomonas sp. TaxID=87 RepID=UPI0025BA1281|nr:hypothetical protein [Hyphomonas sp.]